MKHYLNKGFLRKALRNYVINVIYMENITIADFRCQAKYVLELRKKRKIK
jgi:hypothetical protein